LGAEQPVPDKDGAVKAKNRTDHRHHAIDAAVVAATDQSLVQRISKMAQRDEVNGAEEVARSVPPPWDDFRTDIKSQLDRIIVSHRADHGRIDFAARRTGKDSTSGALHEATALSIIDDQNVAVRIPLLSLSAAQFEEGGRSGWVRDPHLRSALHLATKGKDKKDFEAALLSFAAKPGPYHGISRVRIVKPLQDAARVYVPADAPVKAYQGGSNHRYEVWKLPDGKVLHHVVSMFVAHQGNLTRPHPAAKRIYQFMKGDLVRLEDSKFGPVIATVEKFNGKGMIELVPHNEANASDRYRKTKEDLYIRLGATTLLRAKARRVHVDEMGRLRDPGPPK
jgi:CRISPR-associated endonuclease Csn1